MSVNAPSYEAEPNRRSVVRTRLAALIEQRDAEVFPMMNEIKFRLWRPWRSKAYIDLSERTCSVVDMIGRPRFTLAWKAARGARTYITPERVDEILHLEEVCQPTWTWVWLTPECRIRWPTLGHGSWGQHRPLRVVLGKKEARTLVMRAIDLLQFFCVLTSDDLESLRSLGHHRRRSGPPSLGPGSTSWLPSVAEEPARPGPVVSEEAEAAPDCAPEEIEVALPASEDGRRSSSGASSPSVVETAFDADPEGMLHTGLERLPSMARGGCDLWLCIYKWFRWPRVRSK